MTRLLAYAGVNRTLIQVFRLIPGNRIMKPMSVRILIADDHEVIRHGVRTILQARPEWEICGEAANGSDTVRLFKELKPDISIIDITMPGLNGLDAARQITAEDVNSKILIFTMHESVSLSASVRRVGARGYVTKSQATRELIRAIESILGGGTFFNHEAGKIIEDVGGGFGPVILRLGFSRA